MRHMGRNAAPKRPKFRVGFLLMPRFTLTAFAGFVDAPRLAAGEGDRSNHFHPILRIPLMADSDSTFIADGIPSDGGHPALVS